MTGFGREGRCAICGRKMHPFRSIWTGLSIQSQQREDVVGGAHHVPCNIPCTALRATELGQDIQNVCGAMDTVTIEVAGTILSRTLVVTPPIVFRSSGVEIACLAAVHLQPAVSSLVADNFGLESNHEFFWSAHLERAPGPTVGSVSTDQEFAVD